MTSVRTAFPVLQVESPADPANFYIEYFQFEPIFESGWYIQVRRGSQELAFITAGHESIRLIDAEHRGTFFSLWKLTVSIRRLSW